MVEFKTKFDSKTLNKLNDVQIEKSKKMLRGFMIFFFVMGALLLLFAIDDYQSGESYYGSLFMGIFSIAFGVFFPRMMKGAMRRNQERQNQSSSTVGSEETEMLFRFDKDRMFISVTKGEKFRSAIDTDYDYIYRVYEDDETYILYISKMECYILNKTDLVSGTHEEFIEILKNKIDASKFEKKISLQK